MSKEDIQQLINDVAEIKRALVGSSKWGEDGLIKDVVSLKKWRQSVTLRIAFWAGSATTVVVIAGHVWDYIINKK